MNILDHRILIPKSPELVWGIVSDLSQNPLWQVDHSSITFLTTRHDGAGVRWRYSTPNGREYVVETLAWYDGLGYEYTFVDGVNYRENRGRIRLQEIAEGTVVQWTFSYQVGGLFGGMRNALVVKRQVENVMVDSLKTLWRIVNQSGVERGPEIKSLMRDAPDYEGRAQYKPRHPSAAKAEVQPDGTPGQAVIPEPAYSDDDTRPRPPVQVESPDREIVEAEREAVVDLKVEPAENTDGEPKLIASERLSEQSESAGETADRQTVIYDPPEVSVQELSITNDDVLPDLIMPPGVLPERPVITEIPSNEDKKVPVDETVTQEQILISDDIIEHLVIATIPEADVQTQEQPAAVDMARTETSEVSVFDVFGLPKPSETQEMKAIRVPETVLEITSTPLISPYSGRRGLLVLLRRKRVKVRRAE
jgi:hypothetical protein